MRDAVPLLLLVATLPAARAQSSSPAPPPLRITAIKGAVALKHGDGRAETPASIGLTLFAGDQLATAGRARAEVLFDNRVLRLAAHTELRLMPAKSGAYGIALDRGSVICRVVAAPATVLDLATPSVSLQPEALGVYRIAVTGSGESEIVAQQGHIRVFAPSGSELVLAGQKMLAHGPADNPEFKIVGALSKWQRMLIIASLSVSIASGVAAAVSSGDSGKRHGAR